MAEALTDKERLGFIGEQVVKNPLQAVCNSLGLRLEWTGQHAYRKTTNKERHDVDFKVYFGYHLLKVYELKNWKTLENHRFYDSGVAQDEVISRTEGYGCSTGLIMPNFGVFNPIAQSIIESRYNSVIETGKLLGSKDFKGSMYGKLYRELHGDLKEVLQQELDYRKHVQQELAKYLPKPKLEESFNQISGNTVTTGNVTNTTEQHNTPNSNIDSDNPFSILETIERAKRLGLYYDYNG